MQSPCRQPPAWEPGTAHGESALFYGHLVGELVRRIDGRSVGEFLREEVCGPLGLDFAIGLGAADQARAIELTGLDDSFRAPVAREPELYRRAVANPRHVTARWSTQHDGVRQRSRPSTGTALPARSPVSMPR